MSKNWGQAYACTCKYTFFLHNTCEENIDRKNVWKCKHPIIKYLLHQCISTIISCTFILQFSQSGYTSPFKYSQVWIYTTTSSAACGVQLDIGKTYVITGTL